MTLVFLPTTAQDLAWFRHYYTRVFSEGEAKAVQQLERLCQLIEANPWLGQPGDVPGTREMHIPRTPFTLIYRVAETRIEVLRLWDERQGGSD